MFSHIMVGSNDIARSKKFYDALFVAMGGKPGVEDAKGRLIYTHNGGRFMVSKPIDGKPRCQPVDLLDLLRPRLGGNRSSNLIAGEEHAFEGEERTSQNPKDCLAGRGGSRST